MDFRSDATQEYFGTIGSEDDQTTAVVVCESDQFLVADRDRLLDGRFTVFGKVTTAIENDIPLLQRNKLLSRVNSNFVDELFRELQSAGNAAVEQQDNSLLKKASSEQPPLDTGFAARVEGPSFKVIPIAIYL